MMVAPGRRGRRCLERQRQAPCGPPPATVLLRLPGAAGGAVGVGRRRREHRPDVLLVEVGEVIGGAGDVVTAGLDGVEQPL
uniref:Uncharacterized protein n=1 Tax=Triticum urartu TaxID=4572 RepID=A0A8R7PEL0_TRIUA